MMKLAGKSYRQKIDVRFPGITLLVVHVCERVSLSAQDLNKYLAALPVHNDIPKVPRVTSMPFAGLCHDPCSVCVCVCLCVCVGRRRRSGLIKARRLLHCASHARLYTMHTVTTQEHRHTVLLLHAHQRDVADAHQVPAHTHTHAHAHTHTG